MHWCHGLSLREIAENALNEPTGTHVAAVSRFHIHISSANPVITHFPAPLSGLIA